jgi:hypothetical protein
MSTFGASPDDWLASLNGFKEIMERGLTRGQEPKLFPTLVIETDDEIRLAVLHPAPDYDDAFEAVMAWKEAVLAGQSGSQLHCIGFLTHPNEIRLGIFPPVDGIWFLGRIHGNDDTIEWSPKPRIG